MSKCICLTLAGSFIEPLADGVERHSGHSRFYLPWCGRITTSSHCPSSEHSAQIAGVPQAEREAYGW